MKLTQLKMFFCDQPIYIYSSVFSERVSSPVFFKILVARTLVFMQKHIIGRKKIRQAVGGSEDDHNVFAITCTD